MRATLPSSMWATHLGRARVFLLPPCLWGTPVSLYSRPSLEKHMYDGHHLFRNKLKLVRHGRNQGFQSSVV